MRASILSSDKMHPVYPLLEKWVSNNRTKHEIELHTNASDLTGGDILFLISCGDLIGTEIRDKYRASLVIHASNLPAGRGWSPHIWQILEGCNEIVVTLLEVEDKIDSGRIWKKEVVSLKGNELYNEINDVLFQVELKLMDFALINIDRVKPIEQTEEASTYYPKRTPEDSRLDPSKSIVEQFDLLRVSDPDRYPAFFDLHGCRYEIQLTKKKK